MKNHFPALYVAVLSHKKTTYPATYGPTTLPIYHPCAAPVALPAKIPTNWPNTYAYMPTTSHCCVLTVIERSLIKTTTPSTYVKSILNCGPNKKTLNVVYVIKVLRQVQIWRLTSKHTYLVIHTSAVFAIDPTNDPKNMKNMSKYMYLISRTSANIVANDGYKKII